MASSRKTVKRTTRTRKASKPSRRPRLLFRGDCKPETAREIDGWHEKIPTGWRLVVDGKGGNMASSWTLTYQAGVTEDRRAWVLSLAD